MLRNYLTVGLRALAKNRTFSLINIAGLAIGMAACLTILLFVRYETSYDRWLPGAANTYQFQTSYMGGGRPANYLQMTSYIAGERLAKDMPQVVKSVYALQGGPILIKDGQAYATENAIIVNGAFFDVVELPFAVGNRAAALRRPGTIVLSEAEAIKRFGSRDIVGKTLTLVMSGAAVDFRIDGVMRDIPRNSSLKLNIVARVDPASYYPDMPGFLTQWGWQAGWVYVQLRPGTDAAAVNAALPAWEKRNIPDQVTAGRRTNDGDDQDWSLVNIRDIHLGIAKDAGMTPANDRATIVTFSVVALLILGMACVNFVNLATARAGQRVREVALRKVLGARRSQLITQFLGESLLIAGLAMLVALALVELALPGIAAFLRADLTLDYFGAEGMLLPALGLVVVVGIAGGLYPAFFLSAFKPATVLKANRSAAETPGSGRLRQALVVVQFAVSIVLIVSTAVIYLQTAHARTVDPGFPRDHILQVEGLSRKQAAAVSDTLVQQAARLDGVVAVGRTQIGISTGSTSNGSVLVPGLPDAVNIGQYRVDEDFFTAFGLPLLAGRMFDDRPLDDTKADFDNTPDDDRALVARGMNIVVNRLAAKTMGFADPAAAIGKTVKLTLVEAELGYVTATIVGVVGDARFRSVRTPIEPIYFMKSPGSADYLIVRYRGDPQAVRGRVEALWKRLLPDVPFDAAFSEDTVRKLYDDEERRAQIFAGFAGLAVIVGCLGLFGLAAFTAERRTKEIGIRKVLGARTRDIVRLLVWQFSRPVVIANLIAWPVAWWLMRDWLNGFDDRIVLGPLPFLIAGGLALVIAVVTVGGHAVRIARANPIHALRYE